MLGGGGFHVQRSKSNMTITSFIKVAVAIALPRP